MFHMTVSDITTMNLVFMLGSGVAYMSLGESSGGFLLMFTSFCYLVSMIAARLHYLDRQSEKELLEQIAAARESDDNSSEEIDNDVDEADDVENHEGENHNVENHDVDNDEVENHEPEYEENVDAPHVSNETHTLEADETGTLDADETDATDEPEEVSQLLPPETQLPPPEAQICNNSLCGVDVTNLKDAGLCAGCERVYYCNRDCQKVDWKTHKLECKKEIATTHT